MSEARTNRGFDTETIKRHIARQFPVSRAELIWNSLISAYDRLHYAAHHLRSLKKIGQRAVTAGLQVNGDIECLEDDGHVEYQFSSTMHIVKMHATDCIQNLHAVGDTLAFGIYYLSDLPEKNPVKKTRDISLAEVKKRLPDTSPYLELLQTLATASSFIYLEDFNNYSKHRGLLKPSISFFSGNDDGELNASGDMELGHLFFPQVEKRIQPPPAPAMSQVIHVHEQRPIIPFVESEFERIWDRYVEALRIVTAQLEAKDCSPQ